MEFDLADSRNLIYARPQEYWKIFISSKMAGGALKVERIAAVEAVEEFPLTRAWAWEQSAEAGPYCSERECVAQAGTSDGLVLIIEDELTPITRSEFDAARSAGAPIFMMLKAGATRDIELQRFIKRARDDGITTVNFSSPGELRTRITNALRTWAVRSGRSQQLRARERTRADASGNEMADDFRGLEVAVGDDGSARPIGELVAAAERDVANGKADRALEDLWWIAQGASDVGLGWLALKLLDEIERIIPAAMIDDRWRGWLCNTRGLAIATGSRSAAAREQFERMRQLGRALDDADLESTALQNLGAQDVLDGDHKAAQAKLIRSLEIKRKLGDWHGGLQVLFNLVNVFVGQDKLDLADQLLDDLQAAMGRLRDPFLRSTLHGQRGTVAIARGDLKAGQAHFQEALRCARRSQSTPRMITSMQNLGAVAHDLGEPARARRWYAKALDLAEALDDLAQRRIQRQALALAHVRLGEHDRAAELFLRAAEEAQELGDHVEAAVATADAGASLMQAGEPHRARELTERALAMPGGVDDRWRAHQLTNLAAELDALHQPRSALKRRLEAANLMTEPSECAAALRRAGETAIRSPETAAEAPQIFERELALRRRHEASERWGWRAAEIGATLSHTSQTVAAHSFFTISLRVFARRADRRQAFFIRNDRALASADLGDLAAAVADLRACLQIAERMDDAALKQQAYMNLGEIQRRKGDTMLAARHLNRSLAIARRLCDVHAECATHTLLALNAEDRQDAATAEAHLRAAEQLAATLKDSKLQAQATKGRAHLEFDAMRFGRAATLYKRAARLLAHERSRQLAESLGGQLLSTARRGKLDEEALAPLPGLSEQLGWDEELLGYLAGSIDALSHGGRDDEVAHLVAVSVAVALRLGISHEEDDSERFTPFVEAATAAAWWIEADRGREKPLRDALRAVCGEQVLSHIAPLLESTVEVIAKKRAETAAAPEASMRSRPASTSGVANARRSGRRAASGPPP
jgi:tetratricopeptide (TPR) repeat protein